LSLAPGRHATQRFDIGSHRGVLPPHCASVLHCTHWPLVVLQICPVGQAGFAVEQPGTHALERQTLPGPQSGSLTHLTQVWFGTSQTGFRGSRQSVLARQPTHERVAGLHTGCCGGQFVLARQPTQVPASTSHTSPVRQLGFEAEQPGRHTRAASQMRPAPQWESSVHSTQVFWPGTQYMPCGQPAVAVSQPALQVPSAAQTWP
jgi:hypothetical protein